MVQIRRELDHGQAPLETFRYGRREGHPLRHAGDMSMSQPPTPAGGDKNAPVSRTADITAGPGGVMTDEVGVITGDLTLRTEYEAGQVTLHIQYKDADEWYVVTGGRAPLADPASLDAVHTIAVGLLDRPKG
ncbi:hypothetical protein ACWDV4_04725 [Micromonospora sp. NPDC003197]